jgi:hypothetical protein
MYDSLVSPFSRDLAETKQAGSEPSEYTDDPGPYKESWDLGKSHSIWKL